MDRPRPRSASKRTLKVAIDPEGRRWRTFDGWRETDGGATSVATSKAAGAGASGDRAVRGVAKSTDNITLTGSFPISIESEVRRWLRARTGYEIQYIDQPTDVYGNPAGSGDRYTGMIERVTPASGAEGTNADVAEIQVELVLDGEVG